MELTWQQLIGYILYVGGGMFLLGWVSTLEAKVELEKKRKGLFKKERLGSPVTWLFVAWLIVGWFLFEP